MGKVIRFLAGFVLGLCSGAVAGLLLTPDSGAELRQTLGAPLQAVIEEGRRAASERRAELRQEFADAKRLRPLPPDQA